MALVDDLGASLPDDEISRRKALGMLTTGALGVALAGTAITTVRFLRPNVLFEAATRFVVGRPDEIPVGALIVMPEQKLYVVHGAKGFFAMSAECTHLGCMTRYNQADGSLTCPCHGSQFDQQGKVLAGPAPRPLDRLAVTLEGDELVVDTRRKVDAGFTLRA